MSKHTPGPWEVATSKLGVVFVRSDSGLIVAEVVHAADSRDANARVIAASPDLLKLAWGAYHLCRSLLAVREGPTDFLIQEMAEALAAAIAKAEERQ